MIHGAQADGARKKVAGIFMNKASAVQRIFLEKTALGRLEEQTITALMYLAGVLQEKMNLFA